MCTPEEMKRITDVQIEVLQAEIERLQGENADMLGVFERVFEGNPLIAGIVCPFCLQNTDCTTHKWWCYWVDIQEILEKARGE